MATLIVRNVRIYLAIFMTFLFETKKMFDLCYGCYKSACGASISYFHIYVLLRLRHADVIEQNLSYPERSESGNHQLVLKKTETTSLITVRN